MTVAFRRMLDGINSANKAEQSYLKKLRQYNRGMLEMKENLQKVILPTEEVKQSVTDKLKEEHARDPIYPKTDADKAKEENEIQKENEKHKKLNQPTQDLIKTLTKKLSGGFNVIIKKLIELNNEGKISTNTMLKTLVELNDNSQISAKTALKIEQELTVNKATVGDINIDTSDKTLKELLAELTDNTNEINKQHKLSHVKLDEIKAQLNAANIKTDTINSVLTEIRDDGVITHDTQKTLLKQMIDNADSNGKQIETLLKTMNQSNLINKEIINDILKNKDITSQSITFGEKTVKVKYNT